MRKLVVFSALFLLVLAFKAQTTYVMNNTNVSLGCPSTSLFYDSGGSAGVYANSENFTKTFTAPAGQCLSITLQNIDIENCCDDLNIYDGPSTASPLLANLFGTISGPVTYVATGNTLTFQFTSDGSVTYAGWSATITCVNACSGSPTPGTAAAAVAMCPSASTGTVTLSTSGVSPLGCGIDYIWQSSPTGLAPWTTIAGSANQNPFTTTISGTTYYRMRTQCNNANNVFTNTVTATTGTTTISCGLGSYNASGIAYSFDSFVGTVLPTTDDVLFNSIINFGFPFCYGGTQYWGGYVASNCAFVFDAVPCFPNILTSTYAAGGVGTGYSIGAAAPINGTPIPRNAVLAPWQDTHPGLGGTMRFTTIGTAPNRRFVVSWENIPMFSCGTSSPSIYFTGQVKLFETSNNIEIHIGNKGVCPSFNGGYAIMGLHSYDGSVYRPPVNATAHNYPTQWSMTNTAYRYSAPCAVSGGPCVTLPVNFKNFYGQQIETANKLSWETAVEENVKEFIIERSNDAINFTEIGRALPYNQPSKYDFNDVTFKSNIINYYKITAVEFDGKHKSTFVIPIGGQYDEVSVSEIYPNPAKGNFTLAFNAKMQTQTLVTIKDLFGRIVKTSSHTLNVGNTQTMINCEDLKAGIYIAEVYVSGSDKVLSQQKLVIVN